MTKHRLFWPLLVLAVLLVSNVFFTSSFFSVTMKDGHLYGSLIIESSAFSPCSIVEGYSCLRAPDPVATRTWESCARFVSTR